LIYTEYEPLFESFVVIGSFKKRAQI